MFRCPTLVLYGRELDTFKKPSARRFKMQYPQAVLNGFPKTSRFVPIERPEETTRAVLEFVRKNKFLP